ncbi:hypothetical protein M5K25_015037 [Dendrobium thyrsiflorum]|uniref:Uncharacterized protein n=1 Tax=Dendrobium thyrsiflorum TaxID=117978 RepID=A0ABD0UPW1_DENTH
MVTCGSTFTLRTLTWGSSQDISQLAIPVPMVAVLFPLFRLPVLALRFLPRLPSVPPLNACSVSCDGPSVSSPGCVSCGCLFFVFVKTFQSFVSPSNQPSRTSNQDSKGFHGELDQGSAAEVWNDQKQTHREMSFSYYGRIDASRGAGCLPFPLPCVFSIFPSPIGCPGFCGGCSVSPVPPPCVGPLVPPQAPLWFLPWMLVLSPVLALRFPPLAPLPKPSLPLSLSLPPPSSSLPLGRPPSSLSQAAALSSTILTLHFGNDAWEIPTLITAFDDQGRTDILDSPFFDVHFGADETVDDYVDRILYQLTLSIEQHIPPGRWYIVNRPPTSPNSATSLATTTRGFLLLSVALLVVALWHDHVKRSWDSNNLPLIPIYGERLTEERLVEEIT